MATHGIAAAQVKAGRFLVPPLTYRLVGRPPEPGMTVAYARLCLPMSARCASGAARSGSTISPRPARADPDTLALAGRLGVIEDGNPDPNALAPARVELDLADGRTVACEVAEVLGSPARPLSPEAARAKFDVMLPRAARCRRRAVGDGDVARQPRRSIGWGF